jgi:hypothetical protein
MLGLPSTRATSAWSPNAFAYSLYFFTRHYRADSLRSLTGKECPFYHAPANSPCKSISCGPGGRGSLVRIEYNR